MCYYMMTFRKKCYHTITLFPVVHYLYLNYILSKKNDFNCDYNYLIAFNSRLLWTYPLTLNILKNVKSVFLFGYFVSGGSGPIYVHSTNGSVLSLGSGRVVSKIV